MFPSVRAAGGRSRGLSEPEKSALPVGVCSKQGKRPYQEDAFSISAYLKPIRSKVPVADTHYFGLYDGHAGGRCSKFLSSSLSTALAEDPNFSDNLPQAFKRTFHAVNDQFLRVADQMNLQDGSTCIVVIVRDDKYMIANVGDCRAVLINNGKPIQLSKDQKPTNIEEQRRIVKLGGTVVNCMGISRVNGVLAVARAFGNRNLRQVIKPDAEITQRIMNEMDEYLIIASDGLWDVLSNRDVANFCNSVSGSNMKASAMAEELVATAIARGSMDNTTCICVKLGEFVKRQIVTSGDNSDSPKNTGIEGFDIISGGRRSPSPSAIKMSSNPLDARREKSSHALSRFGYASNESELSAGVAGGGATTHSYRPSTTISGVGARSRSYSDTSEVREPSGSRLNQHYHSGGKGHLTNDQSAGHKYHSSPIQLTARKRASDSRIDGGLRRPTTQGGSSYGHSNMEMSGRGFQSLADVGGATSWNSSLTSSAVGGQARLLHSPISLRTQHNRLASQKFS